MYLYTNLVFQSRLTDRTKTDTNTQIPTEELKQFLLPSIRKQYYFHNSETAKNWDSANKR